MLGSSFSLTTCSAATCIAVGKLSFDDMPMFT